MEVLQKYKNYAPTGFDPKGLNLDDEQEWFVAPVGLDRDSRILSTSNWECFIKMLEELGEDEEENWEIHRFGHWACGWFEIIIVKPDSSAYDLSVETYHLFNNYPVLDDEDLSNKEWEFAQKSWEQCDTKERVELIQEHNKDYFENSREEYHVSIFAARYDEIPSGEDGFIYDRMREDAL